MYYWTSKARSLFWRWAFCLCVRMFVCFTIIATRLCRLSDFEPTYLVQKQSDAYVRISYFPPDCKMEKEASPATICDGYITYIKHHYPGLRCTIYLMSIKIKLKSTKHHKQIQWFRLWRSADINSAWDTTVSVIQEDLQSNSCNKIQLISLLRIKLQENIIKSLQAFDNADVLIFTLLLYLPCSYLPHISDCCRSLLILHLYPSQMVAIDASFCNF